MLPDPLPVGRGLSAAAAQPASTSADRARSAEVDARQATCSPKISTVRTATASWLVAPMPGSHCTLHRAIQPWAISRRRHRPARPRAPGAMPVPLRLGRDHSGHGHQSGYRASAPFPERSWPLRNGMDVPGTGRTTVPERSPFRAQGVACSQVVPGTAPRGTRSFPRNGWQHGAGSGLVAAQRTLRRPYRRPGTAPSTRPSTVTSTGWWYEHSRSYHRPPDGPVRNVPTSRATSPCLYRQVLCRLSTSVTSPAGNGNANTCESLSIPEGGESAMGTTTTDPISVHSGGTWPRATSHPPRAVALSAIRH